MVYYVSNETLYILKNKLKFDCRWYKLLPPPTALYILQRFALSKYSGHLSGSGQIIVLHTIKLRNGKVSVDREQGRDGFDGGCE